MAAGRNTNAATATTADRPRGADHVSSSPASCGSRKYSAASESGQERDEPSTLRRVNWTGAARGRGVDSGGRASPAAPAAASACLIRRASASSARTADRHARERRRDGGRRGAHGLRAAPGRPPDHDVVLSEVDERDASVAMTGQPTTAPAVPVSASRWADVTEVAKWSDGMAARGLPPANRTARPSGCRRRLPRTDASCAAAQACARRPSDPWRAAYHGGAVGTAEYR